MNTSGTLVPYLPGPPALAPLRDGRDFRRDLRLGQRVAEGSEQIAGQRLEQLYVPGCEIGLPVPQAACGGKPLVLTCEPRCPSLAAFVVIDHRRVEGQVQERRD